IIHDSEVRVTRNPVVLCHGLFGFASLSFGIAEELIVGPNPFKVRYWGGIEDQLISDGAEVSSFSVAPVGSIKKRAETLHAFLTEHYAGRAVNLVGHSMGGLDARYLITHIKDKAYTVKGLATIATPHRGSSFMDFVKEIVGVGQMQIYAQKYRNEDIVLNCLGVEFFERIVSQAKQQYLASLVKPLDAPAFANLTREYCAAFNRSTPDDPNVYYSSYAATATPPVYAPLGISRHIIDKREGENDGVVSIDSARWGNFKGGLGLLTVGVVACNHWELVPSKFKQLTDSFRSHPFRLVDFYRTIMTDLANHGC
ncbi:hypothetical protein HDU91_005568, partial [Kappamyces sp. JEL0680]